MNYYEKNLKAISDRYPEIAEYIKDYEKKESNGENLDVRTEDFGDNTAMYVIKDDEVIQLTTLYSCDEIAKLWVTPFDLEGYIVSKIFMFGFGNGSLARAMQNILPDRVKVVVEEHSPEILYAAVNSYDLTDLFENVNFNLIFKPALGNTKVSYKYRDYIDYTDLDYMKLMCYPNYDILYKEEYDEMVFGLRLAVSNVICNQNLYANVGKECNENTFNNAKFFVEGYSLSEMLCNMPKGFPAIVIAGGPSLDKNIQYLKDAVGKALIVCTDTALRPTIRAGVIPDIAISSDALKGDKYFDEEASWDVPLVCNLHVGKKAMNIHRGIKYFCNSADLWIQDYTNDNDLLLLPIETGGSVANDAVSLARLMGADRIILIGQDLAYTDDKTHSEKTVEGELEEKDFRFEVMDVDIYGKPIRSSYQFLLYRDWIEETIIKYQDSVHIIDATEGGILIKGSEIMTLKEAIERECTEEWDFKDIISNTGKFLNEEQKRSFAEYMCSLNPKYDAILKKIDEALSLYSEMKWKVRSRKISPSALRSMSKRSGELFDTINNSNEMEYVLNLIQKDLNTMLKTINEKKADENDEILELCDYSISTLTMMKETIAKVRPQLDEMEESLKSYLV